MTADRALHARALAAVTSLTRPCTHRPEEPEMSDIPYMLNDSPEEFERVRVGAARRLEEEARRTRPGATASEVFTDDVRALLGALGLGTHARPYSAHAVVHRDVLPAIYELRRFATDMINAPEDSAADWGYDLAHRLGMLDGGR